MKCYFVRMHKDEMIRDVFLHIDHDSVRELAYKYGWDIVMRFVRSEHDYEKYRMMGFSEGYFHNEKGERILLKGKQYDT